MTAVRTVRWYATMRAPGSAASCAATSGGRPPAASTCPARNAAASAPWSGNARTSICWMSVGRFQSRGSGGRWPPCRRHRVGRALEDGARRIERHEPERSRPDRMELERGAAEVRDRLPREEVGRKDGAPRGEGEVGHRGGQREPHVKAIQHLYRDALPRARQRPVIPEILGGAHGERDIVGRDRYAVLPRRTGTQPECPGAAVLAGGPARCQVRDHGAVRPELGEATEHECVDVDSGRVVANSGSRVAIVPTTPSRKVRGAGVATGAAVPAAIADVSAGAGTSTIAPAMAASRVSATATTTWSRRVSDPA